MAVKVQRVIIYCETVRKQNKTMASRASWWLLKNNSSFMNCYIQDTVLRLMMLTASSMYFTHLWFQGYWGSRIAKRDLLDVELCFVCSPVRSKWCWCLNDAECVNILTQSTLDFLQCIRWFRLWCSGCRLKPCYESEVVASELQWQCKVKQ